MGKARYALGMKVIKNNSKKLFCLSQGAYVNKILEHFRMHYSKPMDTSVKNGLTLTLSQCPKIDKAKERMNNLLCG